MNKEVYVVVTGVRSFKYLSGENSIRYTLTNDIHLARKFDDKIEALDYINLPCFGDKLVRVQKVRIEYEFID